MATNNPCSKRVKPEEAYEIWQSYDGSWTYFVLKKYQSPEKEATNPFARWYCMVKSPVVPNGEYGDAYVETVKRGRRQIANPLTHTDEQTTGTEQEQERKDPYGRTLISWQDLW